MENKTDKQIQEELRTDYQHRSIFILLLILSGCRLFQIVTSKLFLFCLTLGFMLLFPFVFWLLTDDLLTFHLSILLCLPAHYYVVMREMEGEKSEMERVEMRAQCSVVCTELKRMIKEKLK
jgi:hypothetical protein